MSVTTDGNGEIVRAMLCGIGIVAAVTAVCRGAAEGNLVAPCLKVDVGNQLVVCV